MSTDVNPIIPMLVSATMIAFTHPFVVTAGGGSWIKIWSSSPPFVARSHFILITSIAHELSLLELIPQLSINLTMLLLSFITKYPVVQSGLQSIFQDKKGETSNPSFWIVQLGRSRVC